MAKQTTVALSLVALFASIGIFIECAPQTTQQPQQQAKLIPTSSSTIQTTSTPTAATSRQQPGPTMKPSVLMETAGSNLLNQQRSILAAPLKLVDDEQYSSIDSKNPFGDDSLWQIPIQLVRDLGASSPLGNGEPLAKSASETRPLAPANGDYHLSGDEASLSTGSNNNNEDGDNDDEPTGITSASPTVISASTNLTPSGPTDLKTAAGYHHATPHYGAHAHDHQDYHGKYFQYASVPYPYAWDFGYRRGNPYHTIERHEHGKGPYFQTKVKWSDKYGGYGVHVWDYNHDDHHSDYYPKGGHYNEDHHQHHHEPHGKGYNSHHHGYHGAGHYDHH